MEHSGADKLIDHIIMDARAGAEKILDNAKEACEESCRAKEKAIADDRAVQQKNRETKVREILDGAATRARLDGRKEVLAAKREMLDQAFLEVYGKLCGLDDTALCALYARILRSEAEQGDTIVPCERDRNAVIKAVKQSGIDCRVEENNAPTERGFLLIGKGYEKDCSLKAILRDARAAEETKIAEILFA